MSSRESESRILISVGLVLLLTAAFVGLARVEPTRVLAGVTPTIPSPVEPTDTPVPPPTDTPVPPPTDTPVPPPTDTPEPPPTDTSEPPPTDTPVWPPTKTPWWPKPPTKTPWWPQYPTKTPYWWPEYPTPIPTAEVFKPAPSTGVAHTAGLPLALVQGGLGLVMIGLGLAWRRRR